MLRRQLFRNCLLRFSLWHGERQACLRRLDNTELERLEGGVAQASNSAYAAVQLHDRQERDGFLADHRRDGPSALGRLGWLLLGSSDSDFTRLATRIREAGLLVYGFGGKKTPQPFVAACDKFIYTEILKPQEMATAQEVQAIPPLEPMLRAAIDASARDDGWSPLSSVGSMLLKNNPSFDPRNYGCSKLGELVRRQTYLEAREVPASDGSANVLIFVHAKPA